MHFETVICKKYSRFELISLVLYKLLLDIVYVTFHANLFGYYGFRCTVSYERIVIGWVLFFVGAFIFRFRKDELVDIFSITVFMLSIIPCIIYYEYNIEAELWMIASQLLFLILINMLTHISKGVAIKLPFHPISYRDKTLRFIVTTFIIVYTVLMLLLYGMPSFSQLDFYHISEIRAASTISAASALLQNLTCKIICPLYVLIAIHEKKRFAALIGIMAVLYTYSVTGYKTYLFIMVIIVGSSFFSMLNLKKAVIYGLPLAVLGTTIIYVISNSIMTYALIIERVIMLPAKIKMAYLDFFSSNPYIYFSQSTIGKILEIPKTYNVEIPYLIGDVYFKRPQMYTNTGFLADAYANLGFLGMLMISLFVVVIIRTANNRIKKLRNQMKKCLETLYLLFFISLNDGGAITVVFSGGMIFLIILLALIDFSEEGYATNE